MAFKYETYLAQVRATFNILCPCATAQENDSQISFRWVHDPMSLDDFLPVAILDIKHGRSARIFPQDKIDKNCDYFGLSLYTTFNYASNAWGAISPSGKRTLGYTHCAKGTITSDDGVLTPVMRGHFDLHEYVSEALDKIFNKFQIIGIL